MLGVGWLRKQTAFFASRLFITQSFLHSLSRHSFLYHQLKLLPNEIGTNGKYSHSFHSFFDVGRNETLY